MIVRKQMASHVPSIDTRGRSQTAPNAVPRGHPVARATMSTQMSTWHPDAVKRREDSEARVRERQLEQQRLATGMKWWKEEGHVSLMSSPQELHDTIQGTERLVVVNFFAEDCYACKSLHPKLKKIAEANPNVTFIKCNGSTPAFDAFFHASGITRVPWFHLYRGGQLVESMTASLKPEALAAFRAKISAHKDPMMLA